MYEKASETRAQSFPGTNPLGQPPQQKSALVRVGGRLDSLLNELHEQVMRFDALLDSLAGPIPEAPEKPIAIPSPQNQLGKVELMLEHLDALVRRVRGSVNRLEEI